MDTNTGIPLGGTLLNPGLTLKPERYDSTFSSLDTSHLLSQAAQVSTDQMYDFDARLSSKMSIAEDIMHPLFEKEPYLELAMQDVAHPTLAGAISTLSESSEFVPMHPVHPVLSKPMMEQYHGVSVPDTVPSPTGLSFGVYGSMSHTLADRVASQAVGENLVRHHFTASNPLSGDFATDSFSLMSNPEHDIYGFLSHAVPLNQMVTAVAEMNSHETMQSLSSMPCILPIQPTQLRPPLHSESALYPVSPVGTFRQIYSTSTHLDGADPMVSVVNPVISKEAVVQTGLASVSLAVTRGSPSAMNHALASNRSAATMVELGMNANKHSAPARLYGCPICHKMFERAYNRKMHITTHEAIENRLKPFVCPVETCGKRFARKHDKNRHYMGVHLRTRKPGSTRSATPRTPTDEPASAHWSPPASGLPPTLWSV